MMVVRGYIFFSVFLWCQKISYSLQASRPLSHLEGFQDCSTEQLVIWYVWLEVPYPIAPSTLLLRVARPESISADRFIERQNVEGVRGTALPQKIETSTNDMHPSACNIEVVSSEGIFEPMRYFELVWQLWLGGNCPINGMVTLRLILSHSVIQSEREKSEKQTSSINTEIVKCCLLNFWNKYIIYTHIT